MKYKRREIAKRMCWGKVKHKSMSSAEYVFYAMTPKGNETLGIYKCPFCKFYHIGHNKYKNENSKNKKTT